jgi:N-acylethanolamine-hydrolysing acid amidase
LEKIMASFDAHLGELGEEMKSIADYWGIDLGIVVGLNFAYEMRRIGGGHPNTTNGTAPNQPHAVHAPSACTSIVAQDSSGNVVHGRNLDWNIPNDLRNLTVQVDFLKGGKVVATGVVTAGFVGVLTGISPSGFSASINERELGGHPTVDYLEAVLMKAWSPTHLLRNVLLNDKSYQSAVESISTEKITAPTYYILAGTQPGEGVVLTRDRNTLADKWTVSATPTTSGSWYILETNYDHWKPTYKYDNRRYYGNEYMKNLGQKNGATTDGLKSVLTTSPVQNRFTSLTVLMCPKSQSIESYNVFSA